MKYRIALTLFLSVIAAVATAQSWEFLHETIEKYERIDGSSTSSNGNVFIAGRTGDSFNRSHAFIIRISPNSDNICYIHQIEGYYSNFRNVVQLPNGKLFAVGFCTCSNGDADKLLIVIFDTDLNVITEKQYDPEGSGTLFRGISRTVLDDEGNAVVFTSQIVPESGGLRRFPAILYRFNEEGDTIMHRDLYDVDLGSMYYSQLFQPKSLSFDSNTREFKYIGQGLNGLISLEYFDNNLSFISGHQILYQGADTSLMINATYDSDWTTSDNESIVFGCSTNDMDSEYLFSYKADSEGNIIDYRPVCRKIDTLDYSATISCMAGVDDSTLYYFFHETTEPWSNGNLGVYRLNENLDVLGSYFHNNETPLKAESIHPTPDGGCILVADSVRGGSPVHFIKLTRDDFTSIPLSVQSHTIDTPHGEAYPNPTSNIININIEGLPVENPKLRITDIQGRLWLDCKIDCSGTILTADISQLKSGIYFYVIYNSQNELLKGKFVKE